MRSFLIFLCVYAIWFCGSHVASLLCAHRALWNRGVHTEVPTTAYEWFVVGIFPVLGILYIVLDIVEEKKRSHK